MAVETSGSTPTISATEGVLAKNLPLSAEKGGLGEKAQARALSALLWDRSKSDPDAKMSRPLAEQGTGDTFYDSSAPSYPREKKCMVWGGKVYT